MFNTDVDKIDMHYMLLSFKNNGRDDFFKTSGF